MEEWSISELAAAAATTSRALRHYGELGLLPPSRIGVNGYRFYDRAALLRLQRILLLREFGLGLPAIAKALAGESDARAALRSHRESLEQQRARIERQIAAVSTTLFRIEKGQPLMATEMFDGFDNSQYRDEVTERWGQDAWGEGQRRFEAMTPAERQAHGRAGVDIAADYGRARADGLSPDCAQASAIAARHWDWIQVGWGQRQLTADGFRCLGQMYVDDPRFAANYDKYGPGTAAFARDAMAVYADTRPAQA